MICTARQILFGLSFHEDKAGGQVALMGENRGFWCQEIRSKTDHSKTSRSVSQLGTLPSGSSTVKFTVRMCSRLVMSAVHCYRGEVRLPSVQISADLFQYINNSFMWKGEGFIVLLCCHCVSQSEVPAVFRSESHNFYLVLTAPGRRSSVTAPFCLFTYDVDCWQFLSCPL